jgi:hypothetical protein
MDGTLAIDYRPIGDLIPYARNARTHSEAQVALIAGSIREYGFTNPVLVDGENGIIAGHGRVMAARKLGLAQVPVIELAHLTEAQKRAYILADNKLAEQAGWDRELLALELGDLQDMAVDLLSLGFDAAELDALLRSGEIDEREDDIPPVPALPVSQPGDLWLLGNHRLICGDTTNASRCEVGRWKCRRAPWPYNEPGCLTGGIIEVANVLKVDIDVGPHNIDWAPHIRGPASLSSGAVDVAGNWYAVSRVIRITIARLRYGWHRQARYCQAGPVSSLTIAFATSDQNHFKHLLSATHLNIRTYVAHQRFAVSSLASSFTLSRSTCFSFRRLRRSWETRMSPQRFGRAERVRIS